MTNEERKAIENLSPEEQEVLLKKLEDERRVKNLAEEYTSWISSQEANAREAKIQLLRKLLDPPYPSDPPPKN